VILGFIGTLSSGRHIGTRRSCKHLFREMDEALADGRDWLVGEFSLADINLIPFVARLNYLGLLDIWTKDRPLVRVWWKRARTRPSFQERLKASFGQIRFLQ
jgi:glutathione S-transferase